MTASGSGWTENTLYTFQNGNDGRYPELGLAFDGSGNLYGAAYLGGIGGGGTAFELTPSNGAWTFSIGYSFTGPAGMFLGNFIIDKSGTVYGATSADGANGYGAVFRLTPSGGGWTYTSLYDFKGGNDGAYPYGTLSFDTNGNLYGTTASGGAFNQGVVYEITH